MSAIKKIFLIALITFSFVCSISISKVTSQTLDSFSVWCTQREQLSASEQHTIDVLLTIAGTEECQAASDSLLDSTELDLSDRQLTNLEPLATLRQLNVLYLGNNQITDIRPLENLTELTDLYLPDNQITDISSLIQLDKLSTLYLDNNQLTDLSPLANLRSLTILFANSNYLQSLEPVANLSNLSQLYVANNQIENIQPLSQLSQLNYLSLGNNRVANIEALASLERLIELDISRNRITQLDALVSIANLNQLDLRDNPLTHKTCPVFPATVCIFTDDAAERYRLGEQQLDQGEFIAALSTFNAALEVYQDSGNRLRESDAFDRIGNVYDELGQYANALDYYEEAATIRQAIGDRQGESETLTYLGITYIRLGQTEKAIRFLQAARDIDQDLVPRERSWQRPEPREGIILSSLALAYSRLEDYPQALRFAKLSLADYRRGNDRAGEAIALTRVGDAYRQLGDPNKAQLYLERALDLTQVTGDMPGTARSLKALGDLAQSLENPSLALEQYQQALTLRQTLSDAAGTGETLNAIGQLYLATGNVSEASTALQSAIALWESLRPGLTDADKITIAETQADSYQLLQKALIELDDIETSLEISERGRARAFAELLAHRLSLRGQATPVTEPFAPPPISRIRQIAQSQDATLVEYAIVQGEIYMWVIEPMGEIHFRRRSLNNQPLTDWVAANRLALDIPGRGLSVERIPDSDSSTATYTANLQQLHQLLIEPIAEYLPSDTDATVIVIPQGELFLVPFPALVDASGIALVDQHPLLFAPAISLLAGPATLNSLPIGAASALVVGNPAMPNDPNTGVPLPNLAGAQQEALDIAAILNVQPLIGGAATKAAVLSDMRTAQILHFATHGLLDDFGTGMPGALALAPTDEDAGFLTAAEIMELPLNAQLAVLSACDTGQGMITGDGVVGLSRSLLTAGVDTVLVSLWSIPDQQTALLMTEFYRELQQTPNRAIALRQAMLTTRQQYEHPYHWAAFMAFGQMGA